ncbi:MAG: CoA transferase [Kordiimonadaceae bacterium]|jgi:crotonobetainyl-CoA:carnitine CoA-transferase CaiB-like acyl-CoA transferase|nr:CoA transferase [Kordiimonadaceae bacterium]MBT6032598.1 CoA transferase [Kordiimonadaceae bacterium]
MADEQNLPLEGIKVIEFSHMVMGPAVGVILADMGAEVIKIEPLSGDSTRRLGGLGAGCFPMFNRNKKSICLDLKSVEGLEIAHTMIKNSDIVIENFRPGAMDKLGLGYEELKELNDRLIYCSQKGFLSGPYEHRTALDEVAQMMGGLAYMTGPPGQPLRAGASVIDIVGGMFGAIAILAAVRQREITGLGQKVQSSLFESTAFLVGQHMAQYSATGKAADPMPMRINAWAIYDVFDTSDGEQVFVGVISDTQWLQFCDAFDLDELGEDLNYRANEDRVARRDQLLPIVSDLFKQYSKQDLMDKLEYTGLPFAPISRPDQMFDDPHLKASGGLLDLTIPGGGKTALPALPIEMDGNKFGVRYDLPGEGEQTDEILKNYGYSEDDIEKLTARNIIKVYEGN